MSTLAEYEDTVVSLVETESGGLTVLFVPHQGDGNAAQWFAASSTGMRELRFHGGTVTPATVEAVLEQALRKISLSKGDNAVLPRDPGPDGLAYRGLNEIGAAMLLAPADHPEIGRFLATCGRTTLAASMIGIPCGNLLTYDEDNGVDAVERFFARWPFLLSSFLSEDIALVGQLRQGFAAAVRSDSAKQAADAVAAIDFKALRDVPPDETEDGQPAPPDYLRTDERSRLLRVLMKRLDGVLMFSSADLRDILPMAAAVPVDWLPSDPDELHYFQKTAGHLRVLHQDSEGVLVRGMLASSAKGRWSDFLGRLESGANAADVKNMVAAFSRQVAAPALLHGIAFRDAGTVGDDVLRDTITRAAMHPPDLDRFCWKLLFAGKAAPAIVEATLAWHGVRHEMNERIGVTVPVEWPVPFRSAKLGRGMWIEAIADSTELAREGDALRHCVGDYWGQCMEKRSVIASITRRRKDRVERLSTVELSGWQPGVRWDPTVIQHRGLKNALPTNECEKALKTFLAKWDRGGGIPLEIKTARTERRPAHLRKTEAMRRLGSADIVSRRAGYLWTDGTAVENAFLQWSRFLPYDVVRAGPDWFHAHAAEMFGNGLLTSVRHRVRRIVAKHQAAPQGQGRRGEAA